MLEITKSFYCSISQIYTPRATQNCTCKHTHTFTQKNICFSLLQNHQPLTNRTADQVFTDPTDHQLTHWDFFIERFMSNSLVIFVTYGLTLFMPIYSAVYLTMLQPWKGLPLHSLRSTNWLHLNSWNFAAQQPYIKEALYIFLKNYSTNFWLWRQVQYI